MSGNGSSVSELAAEAKPVGTAAPPAPLAREMPAACEGGPDAKTCMPPAAFAQKLCNAEYPEVALSMFGKGTQWTRGYVLHDLHAWNVSGGRAHRTKVAGDEEVILLAKRDPNRGGIVMVGVPPTYDVLRWDGSCVSIEGNEFSLKKPSSPKAASVAWDKLEDKTREALLESGKIRAARNALDKACGASASAGGTVKCDNADRAFSRTLIESVRQGIAMPVPGTLP
jgi:hypothetical protein